MSPIESLVNDLAELHEAAAERLRRCAVSLKAEQPHAREVSFAGSIVGRARRLHPSLGARQEEMLGLIAETHPAGLGTGKLTKAMKYDQPNVYLTLQALIRHGLIRKDDSSRPHVYYLSEKLVGDRDDVR